MTRWDNRISTVLTAIYVVWLFYVGSLIVVTFTVVRYERFLELDHFFRLALFAATYLFFILCSYWLGKTIKNQTHWLYKKYLKYTLGTFVAGFGCTVIYVIVFLKIWSAGFVVNTRFICYMDEQRCWPYWAVALYCSLSFVCFSSFLYLSSINL